MAENGLDRQQWRQLVMSVYLPSTLGFVGLGAALPLFALTAHDLGATVAEAAFAVALMGVGTLVASLPAGWLADRIGEKWTLIGALAVEGLSMIVAALAPTVQVLGAAVFTIGITGAVLMIARQSYLTEFVPYSHRARTMSLLGGVLRIGNLVGPLIGAAVVAAWGMRAAYWVAAGLAFFAAAITVTTPDLPRAEAPQSELSSGMFAVLRRHVVTYITLGGGAGALMLLRAAKDAILPLWAASIGLDAPQTSLVYSASAACELLIFYLGGSLMDRYGRRAVAVPTLVIMGICFGMLPLAQDILGMLVFAVALGLGNGLSSGVVMTIGSDVSPEIGRMHFLAGWRLTTGLGSASGPLIISALTAVATLAASAWALGVIGVVGGAWLWFWADPKRARTIS